ncbi:MAG: flavin reductase family protein [Oscillospiraceae bacterium]|nr:flavin reductase family protein [Oscillospiraceae bacterium]MCD7767376.1 flavin reductase family protein [Oscillospiraceae bacterium]
MKEIDIRTLNLNPMTLIGEDWLLITAGNQARGFNTMTASWGQLGALWNRPGSDRPRPVATIYVRPQRYTKEFLDRESRFTLSVLGAEHRKALGYLGTHSGRDGDKIAAAGLTPVFDGDVTCFAQARLVLVCQKLYHAPLLPSGFESGEIPAQNYPEKDFHEMYIGEILRALIAE